MNLNSLNVTLGQKGNNLNSLMVRLIHTGVQDKENNIGQMLESHHNFAPYIVWWRMTQVQNNLKLT